MILEENRRSGESAFERTISNVELREIIVKCFSPLNRMVVRGEGDLLVNAITDTLISNHIADLFQILIVLLIDERARTRILVIERLENPL